MTAATPHFDAVCIGETMGQFVPLDGLPVSSARSFTLFQAGAESNVAIGLARLGHSVSWVSRLGDDAIGRRVRDEIGEAGVDTSSVTVMPDRPTGIFVKEARIGARTVSYYRTGSAASNIDRSDVDAALAGSPKLIHLSGITPALSPSCNDAIAYAIDSARAAGIATSFDVNYRPQLWPEKGIAAARLRELAHTSDICFVGLDEATQLWGIHSVEDVRRMLAPTRVLVIKDGARRAIAFEGDRVEEVPALEVDVVEAVGAGDAFAAGFLSGVMRGSELMIALRSGHLMARSALRSLADQGDVMSYAELIEHAYEDGIWTSRTR